ncbi:MAG: glycoside hydrolase [Bacteroidales bacterium]|nr:glycoside hydrolase [Bacteroidales bacterium]
MKNLIRLAAAVILCAASLHSVHAQDFELTETGYFRNHGVDAMSFNDYYPEGHQGGVSVIMHGKRVVTNGDIRFEPTPGQWQPVPKQISREVKDGKIITRLAYPDSSRHATGFNPMFYPDVQMTYSVTLEAEGKSLVVTVDLDQPVPEEFLGKAGFNLEFFPGELFGKPWLMDDAGGIFPQQANAPLEYSDTYLRHQGDFHDPKRPLADIERLNGEGYSPLTADGIVAAPYAEGRCFVSCPDDPYARLKITSDTAPLKLYDGRMNHNNGWFVLRSEIPAGATKGAIRWVIEPNVVEEWMYKPVVQTSQVGYLPSQQKFAVIELDRRDNLLAQARLVKLTADGEEVVKELVTSPWEGDFLRYRYLKADFSDVDEAGLYKIRYRDSVSPTFRIGSDVLDRGVWQPVLEYFLPVQMCHMRVSEKYRIWHDACHLDDAQMAESGNHIDGYDQKEGIPCRLEVHETGHSLNVGGWHDAGDFDLRVESQAGECYILALAWEEFRPEIDVTSIDQHNRKVEIHEADGRNDLLQQVEHGALSVVNGYLTLGRLYRGIICPTLRQYVLLGDAAAMTDNIPGNQDDRWVFTENNPGREINTAANLAATARVLKGFNDTLAVHCENIAKEIFGVTPETRPGMKLQAAAELYLTTGSSSYLDYITDNWKIVTGNVDRNGWFMARVAKMMEGQKKYRKLTSEWKDALEAYRERLEMQTGATPYGVPYTPDIWGAGWSIQNFGFNHYFLVSDYPEIFSADPVTNSMNFVLGCHPGSNQASFASGIGAESATVGYGLNRADWSYIPGGVISGTALIRPDFPELLEWPYLWQQTEYVLGGGSSHYMFLVLAVQSLLK